MLHIAVFGSPYYLMFEKGFGIGKNVVMLVEAVKAFCVAFQLVPGNSGMNMVRTLLGVLGGVITSLLPIRWKDLLTVREQSLKLMSPYSKASSSPVRSPV